MVAYSTLGMGWVSWLVRPAVREENSGRPLGRP
jgi:hypothetical protein